MTTTSLKHVAGGNTLFAGSADDYLAKTFPSLMNLVPTTTNRPLAIPRAGINDAGRVIPVVAPGSSH